MPVEQLESYLGGRWSRDGQWNGGQSGRTPATDRFPPLRWAPTSRHRQPSRARCNARIERPERQQPETSRAPPAFASSMQLSGSSDKGTVTPAAAPTVL